MTAEHAGFAGLGPLTQILDLLLHKYHIIVITTEYHVSRTQAHGMRGLL